MLYNRPDQRRTYVSKAWYEGLPDDYFKTPSDKVYERAFSVIRNGLAAGLGFDDACSHIDVEDDTLRKLIISDMLKVLITEEHFAKKIPLEELAERWKLDLDRLKRTKNEMIDEIEIP